MRPGAAVAFHDLAPKLDSFRDAVLDGLSRAQKRIPCRFLYDERGSDLFEAICETPEYYPTRTEIGILAERAGEIAKLIGSEATLIEFGSGAGHKVKLLLRALDRPRAYAGIEVSRETLLRATDDLSLAAPFLQVVAICADFLKPITLPASLWRGGGRRVAFFPGSSIGNFTPAEATQFLAQCRAMVGPGGGMLVGVDLKKDDARLNAAYNDAAGVTAAFTLNLLERMNRELDGDFVAGRFAHDANYDPAAGRVAIHIRSLVEQTVRVAGCSFRLKAGERIHTEDSWKYTISDFQMLARDAGYEAVAAWTDSRQLFSVHYLTA
ncbi:MAG TPA: L-histidine N(alpha)-methyltransferase [Stellaceae bacterium]|jgi:dimethylhistidine N-methyltransferase|nr:L-histidine N(alpha)-methyltransferase [Stellaceae bacterium]